MNRLTPRPGALPAIVRGADVLRALRGGSDVSPLHACGPLGGLCIVAGDSRGIVWEALGMDRCRFTTGAAEPLDRGTLVRVGVPAAPFFDGLAWVAGRVDAVETDAATGRRIVEVQLRERDSLRPSIYDRVVRHWARRAEAQAG